MPDAPDAAFTRRPDEPWGRYVARRARVLGREREALETFNAIVSEYDPAPADDVLADAAYDALLMAASD